MSSPRTRKKKKNPTMLSCVHMGWQSPDEHHLFLVTLPPPPTVSFSSAQVRKVGGGQAHSSPSLRTLWCP